MNIYEDRLRDVLAVVRMYLPPDGISPLTAMQRIVPLVDPWPQPEDQVRPHAHLMLPRLFLPYVGQRVVFDAEGGWPNQQHWAKARLHLGETYTVARFEQGTNYTRVWLEGHGEGESDWFTSFLFGVEEDQESVTEGGPHR